MIPVCPTSGDDTIFWAAATRTSGCQNEDDTSMLPQGDDTTESSEFFWATNDVESCETSTLPKQPLPTGQQRYACLQEARHARKIVTMSSVHPGTSAG